MFGSTSGANMKKRALCHAEYRPRGPRPGSDPWVARADTAKRPGAHGGTAGARPKRSGGDLAALEVLVRRAVVALGEGRALARLPLTGRRPAPRDAAVQRAGLDLLLDERRRR